LTLVGCAHRPLLGWNAIHRLYLYVNEGHNSLIVLGGPASALFINNNVINKDGGYDLEPKWASGPYERQSAVDGTPFAACATTLPGPGTQVCTWVCLKYVFGGGGERAGGHLFAS